MSNFFQPGFRYGFLFAIAAASLVTSLAAEPSPAPIVLRPGPHLFVDEFLVESSYNVVRHLNQLTRNPAIANPIMKRRVSQLVLHRP